MALVSGTRLGPYEIVDRIGAGAMGEVYSARDARLHRQVAIKVLPAEFSRVPDRVARFAQEAKAAAALNHPGVVSIFDVGLDGDVTYVVSELLEGETLRVLLSRGKLARKRAGDLAAQMAAGMAAAHRKGIIHRDLKPENVFITHDGRAKILDFGLARLLAPGESLLASTADTMAVTSPGMVLGTVGYMAPEQVRGQVADHRSDIFAFGAVFYEMLAGHPAFSGGSAVERMHAVLQHDPAEITPGAIPDPFERIARRCLEKNPSQRFQSADDVAFAIEAVSSGNTASSAGSAAVIREAREGHEGHERREGHEGYEGREIAGVERHESSSAPPPPRVMPLMATSAAKAKETGAQGRASRWRGGAAIAAAAAVGVALGFALSRGWTGRAASGPSRPLVPSFEARTFDRLPITNARFMPDGQTIVYSAPARGDLPPDLFIINANAEAPQRLGVSHAHLLSVSSKGELALLTNATPFAHRLHGGTLARMTIGSSPRAVMEQVREADWSPDGAALAIVRDLGNGRDRLEYPAGTRLHEASGYLSDPRVSPDGSRIAFSEHPWRFDDRGVVKMVDRAGHVTTLTGELWGIQGLAWSPDGSRILFSGNPAGGSLMQPMFVSVSSEGSGAGSSSSSGSGSVAGSVGGAAAGGAQPLFGVPGRFIVHDVARDGRMLAVREDLIFGVRASVPGPAPGAGPGSGPEAASGPTPQRQANERAERDLSWLGSAGARALSRDGAWLLMVDIGLRSGRDYGVLLRATSGGQPIRLGEGDPRRLSPDGKWAAAFLDAPARLILYPTGSGDAIKLNAAPIERLTSVDWFPDGRRLLVCGSEAARATRCYTQEVSGGAPKPLTADCRDATLAPDGRTLLLTLQDGSWRLSSIDGDPSASKPAMGLRPGDRPLAWSRDDQSVYVQRGREVPAIVDRVTLTTGARATVREIAPADLSSLSAISVSDWIDEGRGYAYNYTSLTSTLFLVTNGMH